MLWVVVGEGRRLDHHLLRCAAETLPSYIIDCSNCADPHSLYPEVLPEAMARIYVTEVEMLYKFRDILKGCRGFIHEEGIRLVVITTTGHLFNYQDELENYYVIEHAWELIHAIAKTTEVIAGVRRDTLHHKIAGRFAERWVIL